MKEYTIRGVTLAFPFSAYPSQLSMMNKIISGLVESNNCLLESPTGSGKSLALLCSSLAWQLKMKQEYQKQSEAQANESGEMEDFKVNGKFLRSKMKDSRPSKIEPPVATVQNAPVIFYCTRTHKQIKQIISEMRKLVDCSKVKMTVLSSREHSCIFEDEDGSFETYSKNERCKRLLDSKEPGECSYYNGLQKALRDPSVKKNKERLNMQTNPWDIEDLIEHGRERKVCPYFLSRELQKSCEIIFCPYNYVIDPRIRSSLDVQLEESVVILDEAHNIEDVARSAGSLSTNQDDLDACKDEFENILSNRLRLEPEAYALYEKVKKLILPFCSFVMGNGHDLPCNQFSESNRLIAGDEFIKLLSQKYKLNEEGFRSISSAVVSLAEYEKDLLDESNQFLSESTGDHNRSASKKSLKLSTDAWSIIEGLMLCLRFMYLSSTDFKVVLIKKYDKFRPAKLEKKESLSNSFSQSPWLRKTKKGSKNIEANLVADFYEVQFHIWCMNPSTVFGDIVDKTRCIILASGTLSPMDSFASELGCRFPVVLEAPHVIKRSQAFVGALCQGLNSDVSIKATYQNVQTLSFQDEVGHIVLEICKVIPHGVLFFLPSYKLLSLLINRWTSTGLIEEMNKVKDVFQEPQKGGSAQLNKVVAQYHECIKRSTASKSGGALLIAVCRGKISEGIDFADNEARAVITLGIPYPNFVDLQVEQKRGFNDQYCASRKLLSGSDWYEIQAFRALNQALGRCIRHKNDWGAVILLDERFVNPSTSQRYVKNLPKWIRGFIQQPKGLLGTISALKSFVASQNSTEVASVPLETECNSKMNLETKIEKSDDIPNDVEMRELNQEDLMTESDSDSSISPPVSVNKKTINNNHRSFFNFNKKGVSNLDEFAFKRKYSEDIGVCGTSTPFISKNPKMNLCSNNLGNQNHQQMKSLSESPITTRKRELIVLEEDSNEDEEIASVSESPLDNETGAVIPIVCSTDQRTKGFIFPDCSVNSSSESMNGLDKSDDLFEDESLKIDGI
ncbi:Fanconi anemia group J protein-like [Convolutriloba macropyga]|uniref:Fanconi anemia group J protein-like n=1 Tax=Convolutriloba macropyga TaxID=536237 RepID=UPI003F5233E0